MPVSARSFIIIVRMSYRRFSSISPISGVKPLKTSWKYWLPVTPSDNSKTVSSFLMLF